VALLRQNSRLIIVPDGELNIAATRRLHRSQWSLCNRNTCDFIFALGDCVLPVIGTEAVAEANRNVRALAVRPTPRLRPSIRCRRYGSAVCLVL
jgi:hypothetical protein